MEDASDGVKGQITHIMGSNPTSADLITASRERDASKRELQRWVSSFKAEMGRAPEEDDKQASVHLYEKYKKTSDEVSCLAGAMFP